MKQLGKYTGNVKTEYIESCNIFRTLYGFGFVRPCGDPVPVPKGLYTDFASIPSWAQWKYPLIGSWIPAAVIHDMLCAAEIVPIYLGCKIFREALYATGKISPIDCEIMFAATMIGTWTTYRKHTVSTIRNIRTSLGIRSMLRPLWKDATHFNGDELNIKTNGKVDL